MADETIIDTIPEPTSEPQAPRENRAEERIKQLSDKVELTAKERDELKTLNETTTRERDFYKGYADIIGSQPEAKNFQDAIKEKVLKGYSVQDATYAVLGAEGKLGGAAPTAQVAGGSATTNVQATGEKPVAEMTQDERRAALAKDLLWQ